MIKLDVPYFSQIDNDTNYFGSGHRQCNLSSNAMLAEYLLKKYNKVTLSQMADSLGLTEPESFYGMILKKHGDTTDNHAHTKALEELGIKTEFKTNLRLQNIIDELTNKLVPVVTGVYYKTSGHYIVITGYDKQYKSFIVHDPYGCRNQYLDDYISIGGVSGRNDVYYESTMKNCVGVDGGIYGRLTISVDGVKL